MGGIISLLLIGCGGYLLNYILDDLYNQKISVNLSKNSPFRNKNKESSFPIYNGVYYDDFSHLEHIWPGMEKMNKDPLFRKVIEESQHQRKIDSGIIPGKKSEAIKIREQVYGITYHKNHPSNKYNR